MLALLLMGELVAGCTSSGECGATTCCLQIPLGGRRLLAPGVFGGGGMAGSCAPLSQPGAYCSLNTQDPFYGGCPCAAGYVCTPNVNGIGVCTPGTSSVGTGCPTDSYLCPDGSRVFRVAPTCQFPSCDAHRICPGDTKTCRNGVVVGRIPPLCEFASCSGGNVMCSTDVQVCPNGNMVGRVAPYCTFAPCDGSQVVCSTDVQVCPHTGYSVRRVPPSCAFAPCSPETPGTCPPGQSLCDATMQLQNIPCALGSCVSTIPCFKHTRCGPGYYCYSCSRCRGAGCQRSPACSAGGVLGGDCAPIANCLRNRDAIDGVCPWGNETCAAVTCPHHHYCVPGASNYWTGTTSYTCESSAATWAVSFVLVVMLAMAVHT